jgi:hypothetical protein
MADWKIGEYRVEDQPFKARPTREPPDIKPMSWEEWKSEADRLGYFVREEYHTTSGIYEALDPKTKAQMGEWKPHVGYFRPPSSG